MELVIHNLREYDTHNMPRKANASCIKLARAKVCRLVKG